ncbi:hypothetical protein MTO96_036973 [Rhipicephalus appendiculatus]
MGKVGGLLTFFTLWTFLLMDSAGAAMSGFTFTRYALSLVYGTCPPPYGATALMTLVVIELAAVVNVFSLEASMKTQNMFFMLKLAILFGIIITGIVWCIRAPVLLNRLSMNGHTTPGNLVAAFAIALFPGAGSATIAFMAEEMSDPSRTIPRSLVGGTIFVVGLVVLTNAAFFVVLDAGSIVATEATATTFSRAAWGTAGEFLVPILICVCTFGTLSASFFTSSRLFMAAARQGHLPSLVSLIGVDSSLPVVAIAFRSCIAIPFALTGSLTFLVKGGMNFYCINVIAQMLAMLRLRVSMRDAARPSRATFLFAMDKKRKSRTPKAVPAAKAKAASTAPAAETPVKRGRGRPPGSGKKKFAASEGSAKKSSPAVPAATPQKNGTGGPECDRCSRTFATERGLKMHQRWPCKPEAAKDDADESCRLPLDDVMDSDSDSDVPLGKVSSGKGARARGNAEDGIDGSPDHPRGRLASASKPQLICQRCGLSYDPKRDGPRCKHCTRDNEHSDESGDEEDKAIALSSCLFSARNIPQCCTRQLRLWENIVGGAKNGRTGAGELAHALCREPLGRTEGSSRTWTGKTKSLPKSTAAPLGKDGEAEGVDDGPVRNIEAVTDVIKAAKAEQRLQQLKRLKRLKRGSAPEVVDEKDLDCPVYSRKDNLREHLRAHAGEVTRRKKYKCDHCGKTFHGISLLKIHIRVHTGERPFSCDFCKKGFPSVTALNKHRRIHTGEKPYACAECGMRFSLKGTLNRHTRIHTGIRPHKCPYCGKEFIQGGGLKAHLFHHTGMNGFKCTVCDKVFNRKARLDLHMKYLHLKEKPHVCEDCGKGFTRREDLNRHSVLHTGEKPFQCPTCHKRFRHQALTQDPHGDPHQGGAQVVPREARPTRTVPTSLASRRALWPRILSEQALCESIRELLGLLVDEPTLKGFGYPDKPVDELLEAVIRRCGHSPASPDDYNYMDRLRENSKLLFTVVIDDNAVKTLLNNQTVDEVILHVLRLAKS